MCFLYESLTPTVGATEIMGVQQFMGFLAHGLTQKLVVEFQNIGVLVRLADDFLFVFAVKGLLSLKQHLGVSMVVGLTATTDTSAGAGHDLDGMEMTLA